MQNDARMRHPEPTAQTLVERYALPPDEIERRSLAYVEHALDSRFTDPRERQVAGRVCYAAGDLSLAESLRFTPGAVAIGVQALQRSCVLCVDVRMVAAGLDARRLERLGCQVICAIEAPEAAARARESGLPRAVEAMRLVAAHLDSAICTIGNAPTALLALLDLIDAGVARPALIVGMPVGFVAAAEAKAELARRSIPSITLAGTRGGSPLAAAAVNALLRLACPTLGEEP